METTIEGTLDRIIDSALRVRASDIHFDTEEDGLRIAFRIDGYLAMHESLPAAFHDGLMLRIKVLARLAVDDRRSPKDGKFSWFHPAGSMKAEVRVSMMPTIHGENAVLRLFDAEVRSYSLEELGFFEDHIITIGKALSRRSGLFVISGPTGSGKTTTIYAILSILRSDSRLIITVEDPVERRMRGVRQIEVGITSQVDFNMVLRSILRQDPDIIVIGEIRDRESAELAIQSALTGHLVVSTIHASSAKGIRDRLLNLGISEYLIDASLICALSQRLVPMVCTKCRGAGVGCLDCGGKGVSGRTVVCEILGEEGSLQSDALRKAALGLIPHA